MKKKFEELLLWVVKKPDHAAGLIVILLFLWGAVSILWLIALARTP
jgi:hypothetical protein